jgi:osmotically-inducible protein OsmY
MERDAMNRDDQLRQMVIDELEWEPRIDPAHIGVACRDGVVTLSGHVTHYAERTAAEHATRRVRGVKALAIELEVRLPSERKTADDEIAGRAVKILEWDSLVPHERISIEVEKGIVTLTGTVEWQYQKDEAEFDIRKLGGVKMIINDIIVKPEVRAADVQASIRRALERNADLDASHITVRVSDDRVILDGKVSAWIEREIAEQAAWSAPGVSVVEDRIAIARP